jgi:hypothetical protein
MGTAAILTFSLHITTENQMGGSTFFFCIMAIQDIGVMASGMKLVDNSNLCQNEHLNLKGKL